MNKRSYICSGFCVFSLACFAEAAELLVPSQFSTIQSAIDAAADGDEVVISPGTYAGPAQRNLDFAGRAITVRGTNPEDPTVVANTVIDCQEAGRGFIFQSGETPASVVDGLKIVNGFATEGAGVYLINASGATIRNCIFTENTVPVSRGVIYSNNSPGEISELVISRCTITNNLGGGYGSFFIDALTIADSTISDNTGPGIDMSSFGATTAVVRDCLVSGNGGAGMIINAASADISNCVVASNGGTGVDVEGFFGGGGVEVSNCTIVDNTSDLGAGGMMCSSDTSALIRNCLIADNNGTLGGLAISGFGVYEIANCTLSGNVATISGGGIHAFGTEPTAIRNCILWGNSAPDGNQMTLQSGFNNPARVSVDYGAFEGGEAAIAIHSDAGATSQVTWGLGNIGLAPQFIDPPGGDYRLAPGSPCIDAGDNEAVPAGATADLDGNLRRVDDPDTVDSGNGTAPIVDLGAYEFQAGGPPIPTVSQWGMIVMTLTLLVAGTLMLRRRHQAQLADDPAAAS